MGIYYQAMDHKEKKIITPPLDFSNTSPGIFHPFNPFPNIVMLANSHGCRFEIVNDQDDIYYEEDYEDVTEYYFEMLKRYFPEYDFKEAHFIVDK